MSIFRRSSLVACAAPFFAAACFFTLLPFSTYAKNGVTLSPDKPLFGTPAPLAATQDSSSLLAVENPVEQAKGVSETLLAQEKKEPLNQIWVLRPGHLIQDELAAWAQMTQATHVPWSFSWKVDRGWTVPAQSQFEGTFDQAAEEVIRTLFKQGKPVRAEIWEGNRIFEVLHVDAR